MTLMCFSLHKNVDVIQKTLNDELPKLSDWCNAYKLSVNLKKSKFMIFRPRQKRQTLDIKLEINHCAIERVKETVFWGVILDETFSWKPHTVYTRVQVEFFGRENGLKKSASTYSTAQK